MKEDLKKTLKEHKYKATSGRLAILRIFSDRCDPMSAQDIYKKVKKAGLDLVTVYRTLSSFEKSGILKTVSLSKDAIYYERNLDDHHHIICTECKKVSDFLGCEPSILMGKALKQVKDFKSISYHSFDIFGLCNTCASK